MLYLTVRGGSLRYFPVVLLIVAVILFVPTASVVGEDTEDTETKVAEIEGGEQYASLAEAVAAAAEYGTVRLIADDHNTSVITLDKSISIDGQGFSFSGTFILDRATEADPYTVILNDIVFLTDALAVSTGTEEVQSVRSVDLTVDGCTFLGTGSDIAVTNASAVRFSDSIFGSGESVSILSEGVATAVRIEESRFYGTVRIVPDASKGGSITSLTVSNNTFPENATGVVVGIVPTSVSFSGGSIGFGTDEAMFVASVPSDYALTVSGGRTMEVLGRATFSGTLPEGVSLRASGLVGMESFTGTVLFDSAGRYSLTVSDSGSLTADTLGMVLNGSTGSGGASIKGTFLVDSDLVIGSALTIPEGSRLNISSGARVSGGTISNSGYIDLYGILSSDVSNSGRIMAHSGSSVLGEVTGNAVEHPIPAVVTTVIRANVGDEVRVELSPSEGTEIDGMDGPDWLSLVNGSLQGVPIRAGTYTVTVYASSDEYSISMAYEFVISPAPAVSENGGWNLGLIVAVFAAMFIAVGLLTLRWARG